MSDNSTPAAPASAPEASSSDSFDDVTPQAKESKEAPQAPKKKAPSFRKFKIGDEEVTLSDEDIQRDYSKWKGADAKARETAQARQSVENFMKALAEDPEAILSDPRLSIDRRKLAEKWLTQQIENDLKGPADPRDKKLSEAERRLKEYEDREAQEKQSKQEQEYNAVKEQRKTALASTLHEAMQRTHLSQHPESAAATLREMAMYMRAAKERGEEVSPDELVEHIHGTRFQQFYSLAHQYEGDELIEFLGEEIVNRIRKSDLQRLRAGREQGQTHKNESWAPKDSKSGSAPRMDAQSMKDLARKKLLGK